MDTSTNGKDLLIFAHRGEASHFLNTFTPLALGSLLDSSSQKTVEKKFTAEEINDLGKKNLLNTTNAIAKPRLDARWFYRFRQADVLLVSNDSVEIQSRVASAVLQIGQSLGDVYCLGIAGLLKNHTEMQSFLCENIKTDERRAMKAIKNSPSKPTIGQAVSIRSVYALGKKSPTKNKSTTRKTLIENAALPWPKRRCFSTASPMATHDCITVNHEIHTTSENRHLARFADAVDTELYSIVEQLSRLAIVPFCIKVISDYADETMLKKQVKANAAYFSKTLFQSYMENRKQMFSNDASIVLNLKTISNRTGYQQHLHSYFKCQSKKVVSELLQIVSINLTHSQSIQVEETITRMFLKFFFTSQSNNSNFQKGYLFTKWEIFTKHIKEHFLNHIVPFLENDSPLCLKKKITQKWQQASYKTKRQMFIKWIEGIKWTEGSDQKKL